jgi:hypothetical protein
MSRHTTEENGWCNVVWIDPGEVSGWCVMSVDAEAMVDPEERILDNVAHWAAGQIHGDELVQIDDALDLYRSWPDAACGSEDFILNQFRRDRTLLAPVRINSVLGYELLVGDRRRRRGSSRHLFLQTASMGLHLLKNGVIERTGLWPDRDPGNHARAATSHACVFLRRAKERQKNLRGEFLLHAAWPTLFDEGGDLAWSSH